MQRHLLAAGILAAALIPSFALAQQSCAQQRDNRAVATIAGAGIGALLGNTVAGRGDRTAGTVIGGVGGAVAGNQLAKPNADCDHAYGYYDSAGMWHARAVESSNATGYFDRQGTWVEGRPAGYTDARGRWVPTTVDAYYDDDGQLVAGAAPGHYENGRWVAGATVGAYDQNGRWIAGRASGRRDENGAWVADPQPGYYDSDGRWHAGRATGYYDSQGRWNEMGRNARLDRSDWTGAPDDLGRRLTWLGQRIQRGARNGELSRNEANRALRTLDQIRRDERSQPHYGGRLNDESRLRLLARLDDLNGGLRWRQRNDRRDF